MVRIHISYSQRLVNINGRLYRHVTTSSITRVLRVCRTTPSLTLTQTDTGWIAIDRQTQRQRDAYARAAISRIMRGA